MKTFDQLFAELSAKVADGDPTSGTVTAVRDGVHAAGKKVVEEAAVAALATAVTLRELRMPQRTTGFSASQGVRR